MIENVLLYKRWVAINTPERGLGVAQLVARYLGVVEAVGSSPVTQTIKTDAFLHRFFQSHPFKIPSVFFRTVFYFFQTRVTAFLIVVTTSCIKSEAV